MTARPYAITMWDFSWLERRWPGAGYEDWDRALGELKERGYDAVRIDAYPHLMTAGPEDVWHLPPCWTQMAWGAQSPMDVRVGPELVKFMQKAKAHGIGVALSSWYRKDSRNMRLRIRTPQDQARIWIDTLRYLEAAGVADDILYVDLCNEFPQLNWAPYLYGRLGGPEIPRTSPRIETWMRDSIALCREAFPRFDYTYSFSSQLTDWRPQDVSMLDLLENHIWMASPEVSEFNQVVGYEFDWFKPDSFDALARHGREEYFSRKDYYDGRLMWRIDENAEWSRVSGKPLVTTECWSIIDYKDWPGLDWDWVMDLNARGVEYAASKGRWTGIATSNFCGPQFVGMWRDVAWHRRLTDVIHSAPVDDDLSSAAQTAMRLLGR
jgi:hypothetical protein